MKKPCTRLLLVLMLMGAFLGCYSAARGQGLHHAGVPQGECIGRCDRQGRSLLEERTHPFAPVLQSMRLGHRLGSVRPVRLLPTHGPHPRRCVGRGMTGELFQSLHFVWLYLCGNPLSLPRVASSPRFYYVIALRRILC